MTEMSLREAVFYDSRLDSMCGASSRHDCVKCEGRKRSRGEGEDQKVVDVWVRLCSGFGPTSFLAGN